MRPLLVRAALAVLLVVRATAQEPATRQPATPPLFEIVQGDRVLFLGDALLERENTYGYLETRMHEQFPDRSFTVRNLSWSGDTPLGWSRASFDPPEKGWERLKEQIALVKPTVVFLGYGMAASLQEMTDRSGDITLNRDAARYGREPMSAGRFKKELGQLMDEIERQAKTGAQAFQAPTIETNAPGAASVSADRSASQNGVKSQGQVSGQEASAAATRSEVAIATLPKPGAALTGDPAVLTEKKGWNFRVFKPAGPVRFVLLSPILHEDLRATRPGLPDQTEHNKLLEGYSKAIEELAQERGARFVDLWTSAKAIRDQGGDATGYLTQDGIHLKNVGYEVVAAHILHAITGQRPAAAKASLPLGVDEASEALRTAILRKNQLFFHRWRPENWTYLFGFRKHEQGQNAVEIPKFDPLISAADADIDRLKKGGSEATVPSASAETGLDGIPANTTAPLAAATGGEAAPTADRLLVTLGRHGTATTFAVAGKPVASLAEALPEIRRLHESKTAKGVRIQSDEKVPYADVKSLLTALEEAGIQNITVLPAGSDRTPAKATASTAAAPAAAALPQFEMQEGYEISLWAANPMLEKPIQMNWDPQGRLWIASSNTYPQVNPEDVALSIAGRIAEAAKQAGLGKGEGGLSAGDDKIQILEDTDHDGVADKTTTFADGLLIPTGVAPDISVAGKLACYVGASTELIHLADTDGDGKADERRIVFSGFGTEDTHHIVHTLRWGPDGRLYFNQSIYIHSHLETPWGMVRLNSGGTFAYDPHTERVEVMWKGFCNPWGHAWDRWGQSFLTDGAGFQGITWAIPGAMYFTYENGRKIAPSISPGTYPKFAGLELISSPHFPEEWQGNAITCDFRAHRIVRFGIEDLGNPAVTDTKAQAGGRTVSTAGADETAPGNSTSKTSASSPLNLVPAATAAVALSSGYVTKEMPDLVRTSDLSFRPIDVRLGPDGALYVADWSNPVINHGEVDFRDPRRDKSSGRIWRITRKGAPVVKWEGLEGKKTEELLDGMLSGNLWEKEHARMLVTERMHSEEDGDSQHAFQNWRVTRQNEARALESRRVSERFRGPIFIGDDLILADSTDPRMRAALARSRGTGLTGEAHPALIEPPEYPKGQTPDPSWRKEAEEEALKQRKFRDRLVHDPNPRVRLEMMRALTWFICALPSYKPTASVTSEIELLLGLMDQRPAKDSFYEYAAWLSMNDIAEPWTQAVMKGEWKVEGREKQLEFALNSIEPALATPVLAKVLEGRSLPTDGSGPWIELIGKAGGPKELRRLFEALVEQGFSPAASERALAALREAARLRNLRPDGDLTQVATLLSHANLAISTNAARLVGVWKLPRAAELLNELAGGGNRATAMPELRLAAIEGLRELGGREALAALGTLVRPDQGLIIRRAALLALAQLSPGAGVTAAGGVLAALPNEAEALETWRALLAIKGAPEALTASLKKGEAGHSAPPASAENLAPMPPGSAATMPKHVATAGLRAAREAGRSAQDLVAVLTPLAGVSSDAAKSGVQQQQGFGWMADLVKRDGDPARGELIYRRAQLACVTCHAIGGAGGKVGPDLSSLGASAPLDYIIESVLAPQAKVKEGFHAVSLTLKDGTVATGIQSRETGEEVFLRNAIGQETSVPKGNITARESIGSIMPAGLVDALPQREQLDLFAFLSQIGKPGVFDASKGTVARFWALFPASDKEKVLAGSAPQEVAGKGYTLVDGRLPREMLAEQLQLVPNATDGIIALARFSTATAGPLSLQLTGSNELWLDGKPVNQLTPVPANGLATVSANIAAGEHSLAVKLDPKQLPAVIRAEAAGVRFLGD